jgi:hypothetical protein
MIPVFQTMTIANDGQGNCYNACVASILELPLRDVCQVLPTDEPYWTQWHDWLAERGLELNWHRDPSTPPKGYAIATGYGGRFYPDDHAMRGREISHAAVVFNGELAHDPFPAAKTFERIRYYWTLDPVGRDSDASLAEDAQRLSPEGVAARAEGIVQGEVA